MIDMSVLSERGVASRCEVRPCCALAVETMCFLHGNYDLRVCARHLKLFPADALSLPGRAPLTEHPEGEGR